MKSIRQVYYWVLSVTLLGIPHVLFADTGGTTGGGISNPIEAESLSGLLRAVLRVARDIGVIVGTFFIIYAGFLFVTARGDEAKLTRAKNAFLWSVIGMAILLGAQIFAEAIQGTVSGLG